MRSLNYSSVSALKTSFPKTKMIVINLNLTRQMPLWSQISSAWKAWAWRQPNHDGVHLRSSAWKKEKQQVCVWQLLKGRGLEEFHGHKVSKVSGVGETMKGLSFAQNKGLSFAFVAAGVFFSCIVICMSRWLDESLPPNLIASLTAQHSWQPECEAEEIKKMKKWKSLKKIRRLARARAIALLMNSK